MGFEQLAALKTERLRPAAPNPTSQPTQVDASAPKRQSKSADPVLQAIAALQKHFPKAFPRKPAAKLPLKVGILEDVLAHAQEIGVTEQDLRKALKVWCSGGRYWTCLVEDAARVNLKGEGSGLVSRDDAARALKMEANRAAKASAKLSASATNS
jgi:ProP effector